MHRRPLTSAHLTPSTAVLLSILLTTTAVEATPAIRTTEINRVPACVTPERLMSFLADRNNQLDPRYRDIAKLYKHYGEAWDVRWDYAFFQMALETNYLKYRRGNGRRGDVRESQNNFAGIGATGGGVAGERFSDVKTGVHAQIQHLVAYSGERVADPVAKRTRENQDTIIEKSLRLRRPVTFGDLTRRWAADRAYARSIDTVAGLFKDTYCNTQAANDPPPPAPVPVVRRDVQTYPPPSRLGGPKDQMRLAGPDDMPWPANATAPKPQAQAAPEDRGSPKKPKPPVRTIWTREDGEVAPPDAASPPAAAAAPLQEPPAEQKTVSKSEPPPAAGQEDVVLPRFRITPSAIEPSKLGGPVDMLPARSPARSASLPCRVQTASYGGKKTLLLRDVSAGETHYTALTVLDGFEKSMVDTFAKAHAISVDIVGEYATKEDALADANANCGS